MRNVGQNTALNSPSNDCEYVAFFRSYFENITAPNYNFQQAPYAQALFVICIPRDFTARILKVSAQNGASWNFWMSKGLRETIISFHYNHKLYLSILRKCKITFKLICTNMFITLRLSNYLLVIVIFRKPQPKYLSVLKCDFKGLGVQMTPRQ